MGGRHFRHAAPGACSGAAGPAAEAMTAAPVVPHAINNLVINYVPDALTEEMMRGLFAPFGHIVSVRIIKDVTSGRSKGFGFVRFRTALEASRAKDAIDGMPMFGKTLRVSFMFRGQEGATPAASLPVAAAWPQAAADAAPAPAAAPFAYPTIETTGFKAPFPAFAAPPMPYLAVPLSWPLPTVA